MAKLARVTVATPCSYASSVKYLAVRAHLAYHISVGGGKLDDAEVGVR